MRWRLFYGRGVQLQRGITGGPTVEADEFGREGGGHVGQRGGLARQGGDRGHVDVGEATGDDEIEGVERGGDVEREAVDGDAPVHVHANGGELTIAGPDARAGAIEARLDAVARGDGDGGLGQAAHVIDD